MKRERYQQLSTSEFMFQIFNVTDFRTIVISVASYDRSVSRLKLKLKITFKNC